MNYRKHLVRILTFLGGAYFFFEYVLPSTIYGVKVDRYSDQITTGFVAIGNMAVGLGLINLFMVHGSKVIFRRKGALNSAALLLSLFLMMSVTAADWFSTMRIGAEVKRLLTLRDFAGRIAADLRAGKQPLPLEVRVQKLEAAADSALAAMEREIDAREIGDWGGAGLSAGKMKTAREQARRGREEVRGLLAEAHSRGGAIEPAALVRLSEALGGVAGNYEEFLNEAYRQALTKKLYRLFYEGLFIPLGSAMFSLLGLYMAAAAYRAFRVRSAESALMMLAAVVVMLGQIPFGIWLWEGFPEVRLWLLRVPSTAAFRGITIGAAVAGLVMGMRMWLSIESESFSRKR
jgi:hypothetical protein